VASANTPERRRRQDAVVAGLEERLAKSCGGQDEGGDRQEAQGRARDDSARGLFVELDDLGRPCACVGHVESPYRVPDGEQHGDGDAAE
jgi:hypothetical protein